MRSFAQILQTLMHQIQLVSVFALSLIIVAGLHYSIPLSSDQMNLMVTQDGQCLRSKTYEQAWIELCAEYKTQLSDHPQPPANSHVVKLATEKSPESNGDRSNKTMVFNCITHTLHWVASERDPSLPPSASDPSPPPSPPPHQLTSADHVQLLVTGSLHLVGDVMSVLGFTVDDV